MKKYLKEIETAGLILVIIGVVASLFVSHSITVWPCAIGLLLWLTTFLYRAFHWKEYERENKQNIIIILVGIVILFLQMLIRL